MERLERLIGVLGMILFLTACGDSGSNSGGDPGVQISPADATCGEIGDGGETEVLASALPAEDEAELESDQQYSTADDDGNDTSVSFVKKTMTWLFTDLCPDGVSPLLKLFDVTIKKSWGPYWFPIYGQTYKIKISCEKGDKICYGAWTNNLYWGCGKGCKQYCPNCCTRCGAKTMANINLVCY